MIHSGECAACKTKMTLSQIDAAYARTSDGPYCSEACYDTLFANCVICGHRNMTCLRNQQTPYIHDAKLECACDECLQKKYNVSIVCITSGRMG
jgi:hypothetical protein